MIKTNKKLALYGATALFTAFLWEGTEEGYEYWQGVTEKLCQIAGYTFDQVGDEAPMVLRDEVPEDLKEFGKDSDNLPALVAAVVVDKAFLWSDTEDGTDYWMEVYEKLCKIAGVEPLDVTLNGPFIEAPEAFQTWEPPAQEVSPTGNNNNDEKEAA